MLVTGFVSTKDKLRVHSLAWLDNSTVDTDLLLDFIGI